MHGRHVYVRVSATDTLPHAMLPPQSYWYPRVLEGMEEGGGGVCVCVGGGGAVGGGGGNRLYRVAEGVQTSSD